MCKFHSILGVAIGNEYSIRHEPNNSHTDMAGPLENKPNLKLVMFEAECSEERLLGCSDVDSIKSSIIRNFNECPEPLVKKIVNHYERVKEAITDGKHLTPVGYFADTNKYNDVWNCAIARGGCCDAAFCLWWQPHCVGQCKSGRFCAGRSRWLSLRA